MKPIKSGEGKTNYILGIMAAILMLMTIVYIFTNYNLGFHSDSAAANILAREQMRTGELFPSTWNTSSGIFIFFYNILMIPLSFFVKDQLILRDIAVAIILVAFVLLFRYLSKNLLKSDFYLVALCFFFSGTSSMVIEIAFAQAAYLISLLDSVILLILFLRAFSSNLRIKNRGFFAALLVYTAYLCLYGTLNLAYQIIPFLGAVTLFFVIEYANKPFNDIKQEITKFVIVIMVIMLAVAIGFVGYKGLAMLTEFQSGTNIVYGDNTNLVNMFIAFILNAIGYRTGVNLFSIAGIMNFIIVFAFLSMLVCCVLLFRKYQDQAFEVKILMNFSLATFVIFIYFDFVVYCTVPGDPTRYFFRPFIFLYFMAAYYIYTYIFRKEFILKTVAISLLIIFSFPYMLSAVPTALNYPHLLTEQLGLVNYLRENNLSYGYATFLNAGNNMVLSNFEIEIGGVLLSNTISPFMWLSSTETYNPNAYTGTSFLLLSGSENEVFDNSQAKSFLGEPTEILTYKDYIIYTYPYNIAINNFFGDNFQNLELIGAMTVSDATMRTSDSSINIESGKIVFGPYISLPAGQYQIDLKFTNLDESVSIRLTSNSGQDVLLEDIISKETQTFFYSTENALENFEIVLTADTSATLSSVCLTKML